MLLGDSSNWLRPSAHNTANPGSSPGSPTKTARMVKLVAARDLKSCSLRSPGSSPGVGTKFCEIIMIKVQGKIPRKINVACSGGVDSMAVVDFLKNNHDVTMIFVNHGTKTSRDAEEFLTKFSEKSGIKLSVFTINSDKPNGVSQEEHWRNERYMIFKSHHDPVITCHHLDDCIETWIWSCMHGEGKLIPYKNGNVIRPFLTNRKLEFVNWCEKNGIEWIEDESNNDTKYMRNYIRHEIVHKMLKINPGLHKTIFKKLRNRV